MDQSIHESAYQFVATLAHELRNPIAPIRNSLHILRMAETDPSTRQIHDIMERQIERMSRIVEDLLDESRIVLGKFELRREPVELAAVLRSAIDASRPNIDAAGQQLAISIPAQPLVLDADSGRLAQVFTKLLDNAANCTNRDGQIWLNAHREGHEVVVSVLDNGFGIHRDFLPHIFDSFTRVERGSLQAPHDLGIRLSIVRRMVELHDGKVEVFSDGPGMGSEFRVRLPLAPVPLNQHALDVPWHRVAAVAPTSRRVMIVDDDEDSAKTLGMLLECIGLEVRVENGGPAALDAIDEFCPHVILLDLSMPVMDGCEVARRIRQLANHQNVLLIAMTGWGHAEDQHRTSEAGFDHHLVKPVKLETLETLLVQ